MRILDGLVFVSVAAFLGAIWAYLVAARGRNAARAASLQQDAVIAQLNAEIDRRRRVEEELREARDAAELASHAKSQFLANMSHELRTPLNAMIGFADVMSNELMGPIGTPLYKQYAGDILAGGKHLFGILSDILDMARIDAGKTKLAETEFQIGDAVGAVLRLAADDVRGTGKSLTFDSPTFSATVRADERLVRKIAHNLISNAIKYTGDDGRIAVSLQAAADGGLDLRVTDNGSGIAREKFDLIMQRFGQVEDVFARSRGGIGLGLPLVKALSDLHGGSFSLESEVGQGTTACFHLPRVRVVRIATVPAAAAN